MSREDAVNFQKIHKNKRESLSDHRMKVIYLFGGVADHTRVLQHHNLISSLAGVNRSNFILNIIMEHFKKNKIYCIFYALTKRNNILKIVEHQHENYENLTEVYIGQNSSGRFRKICQFFLL